MSLLHAHRWEDLALDGSSRTCPECYQIEQMQDGKWVKVPGVTRDNWPSHARRFILDGCDSLAEHRAMLASATRAIVDLPTGMDLKAFERGES